MSPLSDPAALPLLRYWATLETTDQQRDDLGRNIRGMESRRADSTRSSGGAGGSGSGGGAISCCEPTRECLLAAVGSGGIEPAAEIVIETEEQAQAWLRGETIEVAPPAAAQIAFLDELQRMAVVTWPGLDRSERWEHLFGCWRRVSGNR